MTQKTDHKNHIAIIGGGLAGLTLALLLADQGSWYVTVIDREKPIDDKGAHHDTRTTAISWGSRNLLKHAGIWPLVESRTACISDILIKDEDSPIELSFNSANINAEGFGWIVDNRDLRLALTHKVQAHDHITHLTGVTVKDFTHHETHVTVHLDNGTHLDAALVIGADGRGSTTRDHMQIKTLKKDYKQTAMVCLIRHTKPHEGWALEHFRAQGPFAVLPFIDDDQGRPQSAIVWTVPSTEADQWKNCDDKIFEAALQTRCGNLYGDVRLAGQRAAWPLNLVKATSYIGDRMVLVAEAAHGMHPIAGQGLNMSFRDLAALTEILKGAQDPGAAEILKAYQKTRRIDNIGMVAATDILNELFGFNFFAVRASRRFGLHMVSKLPFIKRFFMNQAMGAAGSLPKMIREAPHNTMVSL